MPTIYRRVPINTDSSEHARLQNYLHEIRQISVLTVEEESNLVEQYDKGKKTWIHTMFTLPPTLSHLKDFYNRVHTHRLDPSALVVNLHTDPLPEQLHPSVPMDKEGPRQILMAKLDRLCHTIECLHSSYSSCWARCSQVDEFPIVQSEPFFPTAEEYQFIDMVDSFHFNPDLLQNLVNYIQQIQNDWIRLTRAFRIKNPSFQNRPPGSHSMEIDGGATNKQASFDSIQVQLRDLEYIMAPFNPDTFAKGVEKLKEGERMMNQARIRLIEANLRLVVSIAKNFSQSSLSLMDLIQEGNMGLIKAIQKFDRRHGIRFCSYATLWIKQAILRGIMNHGSTIRIPVHMRQKQRKITRLSEGLSLIFGPNLSEQEIEKRLDLSPHNIHQLASLPRHPLSLDYSTGQSTGTTITDRLADLRVDSPLQQLLQREMSSKVSQALGRLTPREQQILRMRFGLGEWEAHSLQKVARVFGLSRGRIRQIEQHAFKKLGTHPTSPLRDFRNVFF